ncbi:MAG TPA: hypothetical protein VFG50_17310 [Rhodothermales bacterium]|nr:hypothetical protein [Rhodothermales bacterium]
MTDSIRAPHPPPDVLADSERVSWLRLLEERFGIPPATFDGYTLLMPNPKYLCIVPDDHRPPGDPEPGSTGMVFLRTGTRHPKLTTAAALAFGHAATRNVIAVDREGAEAFLNRKPVEVSAEAARHCTGLGYVIARHADFILGLGFYRPAESGGVLNSLFPKAWAFS